MSIKYQKITPNLWFDGVGEDAARFYTNLFPDSTIGKIYRFGKEGAEIHGNPDGAVMNVEFSLAGQPFLALNGGPLFKFNPSISFFVICETEKEINNLWNALVEGGEIMMPLDQYDWSERYGWLNDKFGLSWQLMLGNIKQVGQKITPLLFFTGDRRGKAEEAIHFYTSVFGDSMIDGILKYDAEDQNKFAAGTVKHAQFSIENLKFMAMDSGMENNYPFNEAISFIIDCQDQKEIDYYWSKLTEGGDPEAQQCGWLKDRFGVSWQVVPIKILTDMLSDPDKEKTERVTKEFLKMKKFDLQNLQNAYKGK